MKKIKKISWSWYCGHNLVSVDSIGIDITDAFLKLPKSKKGQVIDNVKWIEVNGARQ